MSKTENELVQALKEARTDHPDVLAKAADRLLIFGQQQKRDDLRRIGLNAMGVACMLKQDFSGARRRFLEALEITRSQKDIENEIGILSNLGMIHLSQGHYELALQAYLSILRKIRSEGLPVSQATTLNNLAVAHHYLDQFDEAAEAFEAAARICSADSDHAEEMKARINLAQSQLQSGNLEAVEAACLRAEDLQKAHELSELAGSLLAVKAALKLRRGQVDQALVLTGAALENFDNKARQDDFLGLLSTRGECFEALKDRPEAEACFKQALSLARELGRDREALNSHEALARLYLASGKPEEAAQEYRAALLLHRELFTKEAARMRSEAQVRHQTEMAIHEKKLLEEVNEELLESNQKLHEALAQVRTLRGLLPICSSCKKIRDDDGYWTQIENYVSSHSEAQFSHGLCPSCSGHKAGEYFLHES
jgi:tetratricopeptide (TPR) repeat protein